MSQRFLKAHLCHDHLVAHPSHNKTRGRDEMDIIKYVHAVALHSPGISCTPTTRFNLPHRCWFWPWWAILGSCFNVGQYLFNDQVHAVALHCPGISCSPTTEPQPLISMKGTSLRADMLHNFTQALLTDRGNPTPIPLTNAVYR